MITIEDVYISYLKQKAISSNRPYRIPKEPSLSLEKLRQSNQRNYDCLKTITGFFNTKWQNIDHEKYIACAFKLFEKCSYINLINEKVIKFYIHIDKVVKLHSDINRKTLLKSFQFIKTRMVEKSFGTLREYCGAKEESSLMCVNDYLKGKIDSYTMTYLLFRKHVVCSPEEKDLLYTLFNNISEYKRMVMDEWDLFMKMEKTVDSSIGKENEL